MAETATRNATAGVDAALIERVAHGDADALAELYDRFASMLLALARRILGSEAEAEDVLQEVFVQVWKQAQRYQSSRSSVSTWLVLITRSRSIDRLRTRQVVERTAEAANQQDPNRYTSSEGARNVLKRERGKRIAEELQRLPAEQKEVLELAFFSGLTQSEISARTATPLGTVKTRTLLAMRKLRQALKSEIEELL
jgi:RNA polymerase sigma-70 factor (ECF subfamily)